MAGLRKGCCNRRLERPYTRKSKFKAKGYIKAIPNHRISRFEMGDKTKDYDFRISLISKDSLQIRHNALESARMIINRQLQAKMAGNYFFKINVYPHQAIRENKMLGGAHADRIQSGMAHSFGKVAGVSARVRRGKNIMFALVSKSGVDSAKKAFQSAFPRLPGKCSIEIVPVSS